jgi:hypothetical protein
LETWHAWVRDLIMQLPKKPGGGGLQIILSQILTPCPVSTTSNRHGWHRHKWWAPGWLYWICRRVAHTRLPWYGTGACVLGTICPSFFLLPLPQGE